jgi:two-component system, NtrC family, nitrogen regulation response regulator NtrX
MARILVVDDEVGIRELLSEILRDEGHDVTLAENAAVARTAREMARPDLVLLDIWMPDTDGITLLKEWAANGKLNMPVIMMSGHATIETAVEATKIGALDFLEKPIGMQKLLTTVRQGLDHGKRPAYNELSLSAFPRSSALKELKKRLEQLSAANRSVLLRSSPGGITELTARTLQTSGKPWLDLAADTHPLTLDDLKAASGGVVYAEELGRLVRLQHKNLLFVAERLDKFNLRLVAGTELDPSALNAQGWDEGVLGRVFSARIGIPTLREVRDEIPDIAGHLLTRLVEAGETPLRRLSTAAQNILRQHDWPGGYGELKAAVKSLAVASLEEEINGEEVQQLLSPGTEHPAVSLGLALEVMGMPLREAREIFERMYFEFHLSKDGGNMTRLAEKTGLERTHLYRKLKDLGLR